MSSSPVHRRARPVMERLGVPIVDAAKIVDGQLWATHTLDGRHYHPIVPMEVMAFLQEVTAPPRLHPAEAVPGGGSNGGSPGIETVAVVATTP